MVFEMKKTIQIALLFFVMSVVIPNSGFGAGVSIVNDPINTLVNETRNALLEAKWIKSIALAFDRLKELKSQTLELVNFHAGLDEIIDSSIGDLVGELFSERRDEIQEAFLDVGLVTPQIEISGGVGTPSDIRFALERATGEIPEGNLRSFIPFEEAQVVDAFFLADQIRDSGQSTRLFAEQIVNQAKQASPKGAARLQVQGTAQLVNMGQQSQEVLAKLLELTATQVEQVSRVEKEIESQRVQYASEASEVLEGYFAGL